MCEHTAYFTSGFCAITYSGSTFLQTVIVPRLQTHNSILSSTDKNQSDCLFSPEDNTLPPTASLQMPDILAMGSHYRLNTNPGEFSFELSPGSELITDVLGYLKSSVVGDESNQSGHCVTCI